MPIPSVPVVASTYQRIARMVGLFPEFDRLADHASARSAWRVALLSLAKRSPVPIMTYSTATGRLTPGVTRDDIVAHRDAAAVWICYVIDTTVESGGSYAGVGIHRRLRDAGFAVGRLP